MTSEQHQQTAAAELLQTPQGPQHALQQHHRQQQSEPQLLAVTNASGHRKRHSEFNLAGLGCGDGPKYAAASPVEEASTCDRVDGHEHLDHVMADADLPMGVERLATCLLTDGPWFRDFLRRRRTFGIEAGDFVDENGCSGGGGGIQGRRPGDRRSLRYWLRINYAIGPKQTLVEETQTYRWCEQGKVHIIDSEVHNRDIPYGTSFHTLNRLCLTSRGPGRSHLTITSRTVFTRHVFLAKGFIESNVREGSQTYFRLMVETLLDPTAGRETINDDDGGSDNGGGSPLKPRTPASASAGTPAQSPSSGASTESPASTAAKRQDSVGRRRLSTSSAAAAAAGASPTGGASVASANASAANRRSRRTAHQSSRSSGGHRALMVCLLLACLLMLGCLFSLHLRFRTLDFTLAQLQSVDSVNERSAGAACLNAASASAFASAGGGVFSREQLDIWRRTLDETMGSLDGLLYELRQIAATASSHSRSATEPACSPRS